MHGMKARSSLLVASKLAGVLVKVWRSPLGVDSRDAGSDAINLSFVAKLERGYCGNEMA